MTYEHSFGSCARRLRRPRRRGSWDGAHTWRASQVRGCRHWVGREHRRPERVGPVCLGRGLGWWTGAGPPGSLAIIPFTNLIEVLGIMILINWQPRMRL